MNCSVCGGRRRILVSSDPGENRTMACPGCGLVSELQEAIKQELIRARKAYPQPFNSAHEGWAVLYEELDELQKEVFKKPSQRDKQRMREECIQIAAMAIMFAEDLT